MSRRRLDAELVRRKLAESRTAATRMIEDGLIEVDGYPATKAATQVNPEQSVRVVGDPNPFVSRGGTKLAAALEAFPIATEGRSAVDVGASTGGFTDCLLQHGAIRVVAVDVGYGQLHWKLRQDERVEVVERTNIRKAKPDTLGAPFGLVVADLSFIGLATVAPELAALGDTDTDWIVLVKPQFEAGRQDVGRGGIVRDPEVRAEAVLRAVAAFADAGLAVHGAVASPITGAKGNREFLLWLRREPARMSADDVGNVVKNA